LGNEAESFLQAQRTFFAEPRVVVVAAVLGVADARIAVTIVARLRREGIARQCRQYSGEAEFLGGELGL
jgi:NO-binding membrane sensor protein with MHYT domain